jgi:hypothetical protein
MFTDGSIPSGVYSGVDAKIVVHMPAEDGSEAMNRLQDLERELNRLERGLARASTEDARSSIQTEITANLEAQTAARENLYGSQAVTKTLAEIQTISISNHRSKTPVNTLGSTYPRGFTRGPRTISGSMVATVFNEHMFEQFFDRARYRSTGVGDWDRFTWTSYMTDQLPPLDVSMVLANEYGNISWVVMYGLEFVNEGMVLSVDDMFVEMTAQYYARDCDYIRNVANRRMTRQHGVGEDLTGTQLMQRDQNLRVRGRRNPFI